ncbi:hypothetical protein SDC9_63743 [bioreactor metagenome]|uniref:Uncharacterized protein n=1 Tax=bioreactor metagenome TaxID=1076179 RepID=A0A644XTA8_9ZZZZ
MAEKNFFPRTFVLEMTKAKRNPTMVEAVAVKAPRVMLPFRAVTYCLVVRMDFHVSRENFPSCTKVSRTASKRG